MTRHAPPVFLTAVALGLSVAASASGGRAPAATGHVEGRVTFAGEPPPPVIVIQDGGEQQVLYIGRGGGLQYAVVFLVAVAAESGGPAPAGAATLNQRSFIFEPQVLAVRAGQEVRFTSDDPANHNVRARDGHAANIFSIDTASGSVGSHRHRFVATPPDRPLRLSCDIHPWMAAWLYVFDHDRFAVTDADGRFRLDGQPAGRHRIGVRQPAGGLARDVDVQIEPGTPTRVDVHFTPADLGLTTPAPSR